MWKTARSIFVLFEVNVKKIFELTFSFPEVSLSRENPSGDSHSETIWRYTQKNKKDLSEQNRVNRDAFNDASTNLVS